jgi:hypothetical protein
MFRQDCTCPALLESQRSLCSYGAVTHLCPPFQTVPIDLPQALAWSAFARHY